ncbi:MAG: hypothetical protein ACE5FN_11530 [Leptospirillia bacterium]
MIKQCCGSDGRPDMDKMKAFMRDCGMKEFGDEHLAMMQEFCSGKDSPSFEVMMAFMEHCGCHEPGGKPGEGEIRIREGGLHRGGIHTQGTLQMTPTNWG